MSLYKRGNVYWSAIWIDGVRHMRSLETSNRRQAEMLEQRVRDELHTQRFQLPHIKPEMPFGELYARLLAEGDVKAYHRDRAKMLLPFFSETPIGQITKNDIARYRKHRHEEHRRKATNADHKPLSETTVNRDIEVIRHLLFWAVDEGFIAANPIARIRMAREPLRALHALEAKLQQVRREKPEAEALWLRIRKDLGDTPPPYFQAILMAAFALFALTLDTLFLAPTMDILNIANPTLQFLAAAGFAALCTAYFELAGLLYIGAEDSWPKRLTAIAVGSIGVMSLTVWGLLRGYQLRFAAVLAGNPLGSSLPRTRFLRQFSASSSRSPRRSSVPRRCSLDGLKYRMPGHGDGCGSGSRCSAPPKSNSPVMCKPNRSIWIKRGSCLSTVTTTACCLVVGRESAKADIEWVA